MDGPLPGRDFDHHIQSSFDQNLYAFAGYCIPEAKELLDAPGIILPDEIKKKEFEYLLPQLFEISENHLSNALQFSYNYGILAAEKALESYPEQRDSSFYFESSLSFLGQHKASLLLSHLVYSLLEKYPSGLVEIGAAFKSSYNIFGYGVFRELSESQNPLGMAYQLSKQALLDDEEFQYYVDFSQEDVVPLRDIVKNYQYKF
ncbi:MAG: hypothetical protein KC535_05865 [Nanoarchaeota archaeon]|nr:hypothetical protein [Nanoarchaeota archaeon]